ncbi:MAG: hypothetical protein Kow00108_10030 [Calditrichia bacterium]
MVGRNIEYTIISVKLGILLLFSLWHSAVLGQYLLKNSLVEGNAESMNGEVSRFREVILIPEYVSDGLKELYTTGIRKPQIIPNMVSILFVVSALDDETKDLALRNRSNMLTSYFDFMNHFGDKEYMVGGALALQLGGILLNDPKKRMISNELLTSFGIGSLITHSIKRSLGRTRPYATDDPYRFLGPNKQVFRQYSLPSGHSTIAFAAATVLAERTESKYLRWLYYGVAASTSLARIYKNKHWLSDVVGGATIGYFSAKLVIRVSDKIQLRIYGYPLFQE